MGNRHGFEVYLSLWRWSFGYCQGEGFYRCRQDGYGFGFTFLPRGEGDG